MKTEFLLEGGLHGHMSHMHENPELTFSQIKDVFEKAASGELEGTEKTDGQNLYVSYSIKDGKAKAVRNKTQIRAGGLDAEALANQYKNHPNPNVRNAFVDTFDAFEKVAQSLPPEQQLKFFGEDADVFYNAEVMDPRSANVIYYDIPTLLIHRVGHVRVNPETDKIEPVDIAEYAEALESQLSSTQENLKDRKFNVELNALRQLEKLDDDRIAAAAMAELEEEIGKYGISDDQTIGEYITAKLLVGPFADLDIPMENMQDLIKRILGMKEKEKDKKGEEVLRNIPVKRMIRGISPEAGKRVRDFVKNSGALFMEEVAPIETIIHHFAVELLKTFDSAFIFNNEAEAERLQKEVQKAIDIIQASGREDREDRMEILQRQLNKLKSAENIANAAEGFVFDIDGHTYKFTGNFAPINQILGLFKYGRGKATALPDLTISDEPSKGEAEFFYKKPEAEEPYIREGREEGANYVFVPGGFKPPHKGHLSLIKKAHDFGGPDSVTYVFSGKDPRVEGDVVVTADKAEKVFNKLLDHAQIPVGNEEPGKVTLVYFDEMEVPDVKYADNQKNRKLGRVGDPIKTKSPMVAIGKKAADSLPDGSTLNVVSSVADKGHGSALQTIIEKVAAAAGKDFTVNSLALEASEGEPGKKISATDMRKALAARDFETFRRFLPDGLEEGDAKEIYEILLGEDLEEASGVGAIAGYSLPLGHSRPLRKKKVNKKTTYKEGKEKNMSHTNLKSIIKEVISEHKKEYKEMHQIRNVIKRLIKEASDDAPTKSTGINKLISVLKIILPTIESGFKSLTTDKDQRLSFKRHLVQAIIDTLAPQDVMRQAAGGESPATTGGSALQEQELDEQDIELKIKDEPLGVEQDETPESRERDAEVLKSVEGDDTEVPFPKFPYLDETGRDEAVDTYKKIIDAIVRTYRRLHNDKDRDEYKEYLVTNLLLYFDKFESDIARVLPPLSTPAYEKEMAAKKEFEAAAAAETEEEEVLELKEAINNAIVSSVRDSLNKIN